MYQGPTTFYWGTRSYRKYILQITQPSLYGYAKLQYRFAVTSGSPSRRKEWMSKVKGWVGGWSKCALYTPAVITFYPTRLGSVLPASDRYGGCQAVDPGRTRGLVDCRHLPSHHRFIQNAGANIFYIKAHTINHERSYITSRWFESRANINVHLFCRKI